MGQPDITADDTVVSDDGIAAKQGCSGVNNDVVANVGMAFDSLNRVAVLIQLEDVKRFINNKGCPIGQPLLL